jgi:hypothetical protein
MKYFFIFIVILPLVVSLFNQNYYPYREPVRNGECSGIKLINESENSLK